MRPLVLVPYAVMDIYIHSIPWKERLLYQSRLGILMVMCAYVFKYEHLQSSLTLC